MHPNFENQLRTQIEELEERRVKLSSELARVDGHLNGLRQALSIYRGELHHAPGTETRGSRVPNPRNSAAWAYALKKMESAPPDGINVDELDAALKSAGHEISRVTLRANLSNAAKEGVIKRVSYGRYRKPRSDTNSAHSEHENQQEIGVDSDANIDTDNNPNVASNPAT